MSKRHTKQSNKQAKGQFYTKNCDYILSGYEHIVSGKMVVDPFAGEGDLLSWAMRNGASSSSSYDIDPNYEGTIQRDTLMHPINYSGYVLVTNPPYLNQNKCKGDKSVFHKWKQNDYYKCHLASLAETCDEAIEILPSNFFCESRDGIRRKLFETHHIVSAKYWEVPSFDDASTGTCVVHLRKGKRNIQTFPMKLFPSTETVGVVLESKYHYLFGKDFFEDISRARGIRIEKTIFGDDRPNTNLVVGLLDKGTWNNGIRYNDGDPIFCSPKSFTTYQINLPDFNLSIDEQKLVSLEFQNKLQKYRRKYHSLFLSNFMGPSQKILSRSYVHKLLETTMSDLGLLTLQPTLLDFEISK